MAVVGELITADMTEHVRMGFEGEACFSAGALNQPAKPAVENGAFRSVIKTNSA